MKDWLGAHFRRIRHFRDDEDLQEELRIHTDLLAEDHLASGLPLDEAARRARLQVGKPRVLVEKVRDQEFVTRVEDWWRDIRLGIRALRKNPIFCLTAILTLALGIGANTAAFTLLHGLLLRSLPVPNPHRLARIGIVSAASQSANRIGYLPYQITQQFRRQQRSFNGVFPWIQNRVSMADESGALRVYTADFVGGNAFDVLELKPYLGRLFNPDDDVAGGPPTGWPVVLDYGFWKDRFASDPEILGKSIKLADTLTTVIGVTPPDFHGLSPGMDSKLYLPSTSLDGLRPELPTRILLIPSSRSRRSAASGPVSLWIRRTPR